MVRLTTLMRFFYAIPGISGLRAVMLAPCLRLLGWLFGAPSALASGQDMNRVILAVPPSAISDLAADPSGATPVMSGHACLQRMAAAPHGMLLMWFRALCRAPIDDNEDARGAAITDVDKMAEIILSIKALVETGEDISGGRVTSEAHAIAQGRCARRAPHEPQARAAGAR